MPQAVTFTLGAKIDNGPTITSSAKFEIDTYLAITDEVICKCSSSTSFSLPAFAGSVLVLVSSDKYMGDKDCVPANGMMLPPRKYLQYALGEETLGLLTRPEARYVTGPNAIKFQNDLTVDVKVSVVILKLTEPKGAEGTGPCCNPQGKTQVPAAAAASR